MNAQTERAIYNLRRVLPSAAEIHKPLIEQAIDALAASAAANQTAQKRIEILEARERAEVTA